MHAFRHIRANAPSQGRALALVAMYVYAGNYWMVGRHWSVTSWKLVLRCLFSTQNSAELVRVPSFVVCHRCTAHNVITSHHCHIIPLIHLQTLSSIAALIHNLNLPKEDPTIIVNVVCYVKQKEHNHGFPKVFQRKTGVI